MSASLSQSVSRSFAPSMSQSIAPSATQPTTSVSSAVTPSDGTGAKQTSDDESGKCFILIGEGRFYRGLYFVTTIFCCYNAGQHAISRQKHMGFSTGLYPAYEVYW